MLNADELDFLKGVVTDSGYPYYVVYPESFGANNRLIHIYLSKSPVEVNGSHFDIKQAVYMQMSHDEYIKIISEGDDVSFDIPVQDTMCYTSTPATPLYPTIYQTSGSYNYDLDINYPLVFAIVFGACLLGGAVKSILFGGK